MYIKLLGFISLTWNGKPWWGKGELGAAGRSPGWAVNINCSTSAFWVQTEQQWESVWSWRDFYTVFGTVLLLLSVLKHFYMELKEEGSFIVCHTLRYRGGDSVFDSCFVLLFSIKDAVSLKIKKYCVLYNFLAFFFLDQDTLQTCFPTAFWESNCWWISFAGSAGSLWCCIE